LFLLLSAVGALWVLLKPTRRGTVDVWALDKGCVDHFYAVLTGIVAGGRGLPPRQVNELARGRVWTGADALANGLVDELGGLDRAAAIARRRAGLPATAPLRIYPRTAPLDRLRSSGAAESRPAALLPSGAAPLAAMLAEAWGPVWRLATQAGLPPYGPLTLQGSWTFD
jgi:protease IV